MRHWPALLAMLAAIMLVIGGSPAVASTEPCNPCPPDCAMMRAAASADQQTKAPQQQERPAAPCKASIVCQTAMTMPVLPQQGVVVTWVAPQGNSHPLLSDLRAPSRPPDRALRPPIQL